MKKLSAWRILNKQSVYLTTWSKREIFIWSSLYSRDEHGLILSIWWRENKVFYWFNLQYFAVLYLCLCTHCAACRCRRYLRWSRCAAEPRSAACLCRQRPRGPCRRGAICMDSPSHRRAQSRSGDEGGRGGRLTLYDVSLKTQMTRSACDRLSLLKLRSPRLNYWTQ